MAVTDLLTNDPLVRSVAKFVREHMSSNDASHNFEHIQRVVGLAQHMHAKSPRKHLLDFRTLTLSALLHDVGDRKYLKPGEDQHTMVLSLLLSLGAPPELAREVQAICLGVSLSAELADPARVRGLVDAHPELAVVQDADRLDAIGAVGVGRCFAFGGARTEGMEEVIGHLGERLCGIEGLMKTDVGRKMAVERARRLRLFREWWREEVAFLEVPPY